MGLHFQLLVQNRTLGTALQSRKDGFGLVSDFEEGSLAVAVGLHAGEVPPRELVEVDHAIAVQIEILKSSIGLLFIDWLA